MKKIYSLNLEALKNKEYVAFMRFVHMNVPNYPILRQCLAFFVNRFTADYEQLDRAYLKIDVDACTKAVQDADTERNRAFRHLKDLIGLALTYPESEAKKQAAEELMRVIELYGGYRIPNQGQTAKSATISNLVEDFETKFATDVATLGIGSQVNALKAAQTLYDEKYAERTLCESEVVKGAMADARRKTDESYRLLVNAINLKAYEDEEGKLDAFINFLNVEIGRNRTYTGQGQVGAAKPKPVEGETVPTEPSEPNEPSEPSTPTEPVEPSEPGTAEPSEPGMGTEPETGEPQTWPVINPDDPTIYTGTLHVGSTYYTVSGKVNTPIDIPAPEEGTMWPTNMPSVMPPCDFQAYTMPVDSDVTTLYKLEYKDGDTILRTDYLHAGDIVFLYAAPDGKRWSNIPRYQSMPARDWTVYTKED